jgi:hypothetical protein
MDLLYTFLKCPGRWVGSEPFADRAMAAVNEGNEPIIFAAQMGGFFEMMRVVQR